MRKSLVLWLSLLLAVVLMASIGTSASAGVVAVRFFSNGGLVLAQRGVPTGMSPAEAAVRALVAGPTQAERADGLSSRIPVGVSINKLTISDSSATIDMSAQVLNGLDEAGLQAIFDQFRTTLGDFSSILSIKLTSGGKPLSSYLTPSPQVGQPATANPISVNGVGLAGKKVAVGPSHGRYWVGWWGWQRSDPCAFGEAVLEDTNSVRLVQFLKQYLTQDGATFICPRQLDESDCCNSDTGLPWWKMCAESWLHHAGAPSSVWASYSGNTGGDTATDRSSDDIRARPLWADNQGSDIYIAHHTNAGGGGTANGTETYRDTAMEHSAHVANSLTLATQVQNNVIDAIRTTFDGESGWSNRGVKDSAGGFGEIRIPDRPACLIELAFHDNCSRDASYLTDDFFRSVAEWGIYKGICAYFGNTPTWDKYSDEYVSDTIPSTMGPGQNYNVSVTFRNRGVCWSDARSFRLGAVGDSDPFTSFTRVNISGTVRPGNTYTYNFTLTAPSSPGTYTTDWRMVRDSYAWFGATVSKQITVGSDTQAPTVPQNLHSTGLTNSSISLAWNASTDNYGVAGYRVYRNGSQVGTATGTTYTDSGLSQNTTYSYQVDAYDAVPNYSAKSTGISATTAVMADPADQTGSGIASWTGNSDINPTSMTGPWATATDCGTYWYCYSHYSSCAARGFTATYNPGFVWSGRGWIHMDYVNCGAYAYTNDILRYRNQDGGLTGATTTWNTCSYACSWQSVLDGYTDNVYNWNGIYLNADESTATSGCGSICGSAATSTREIHMYGSRYQYINDFTCLGPITTANPGAISDNPTSLDEANLYLYPAVDTTHGNVFRFGSTSLVPGRVTTGDCNNANSLNFKGNAAAYGGDYCNAYGFAWVYTPAGAGPKFDIGSDDGNRVWVNGSLINDNNSFRGLTRDSDVTGGISLSTGWNRVLFKVHSGTGGYEGTISLRNGGDNRANEPSVNVFDLGGYLSYGLGYEQDAWYPHIDVANFTGTTNPQAGAQFYTNNTTVAASGTAWQVGPVPFWKMMHFEWGYGISGDTYYTDVSSSGTTWSHSQTGVTGHRRFHFFGVSSSHRTSFQSGTNSGKTGGSTWVDGGPGNYMDIYVDNVAPQTPSAPNAVADAPNAVSLTWAIPLDQGVNIANSAAEATTGITSGGANGYVRGDVGVSVRRNGDTTVYSWGTGTAASDTGLDSNTQYTYDMAARDNTSGYRGVWNNPTGYGTTAAVYTLADAPAAGTNITAPAAGTYRLATWPGVTSGSFGTGNHLITKFKYKWSTSASDSITEGLGTDWTGGTMSDLPSTDGTYYLYVRSYNAATAGNGSTKFGPYVVESDVNAPTLDVTVTDESTAPGGDFLKGKVTVDATAADTESGVAKVEFKVDDGTYSLMTLSDGTYSGETTIDATWSNGAHSITVKATDNSDNFVEVAKDFTVNKNEASGLIAMQGLTDNSVSRPVTFVLNGTITQTVTLTFVNGQANYTFTDVGEITSISAKTAWSLRKKLVVTPVNGQSAIDFSGSSPLPGGDLNGDNVVNALDYAILRGAWGQFSAGDITGDGWTNNADYLLLKSSWYKRGDPE